MIKKNKTELLPPSIFLGLPDSPKALLASKSLGAPRFAFEIMSSMSQNQFVERRFELATSMARHGTSLSLLCLESGQMGLARGLFLFFRKKGAGGQPSENAKRSSNAGRISYYEHIGAIIQDRFTDGQVLRARPWIAQALHAADWRPNVACEARQAFAAGRPLLGLALCEMLLLLAPSEIAAQTSLDVELPRGLQTMPIDWADEKSKNGSLAKSWGKSIRGVRDHSPDGWRREPLTISTISNSSLLPLASMWSSLLATTPASHPQAENLLAASARLAAIADALWTKGALTSSSDYVSRFSISPLSPSSPQITFLKECQDPDAKAPAQSLYLAAAMDPTSACGDGQLLWDAFINSHLDVVDKCSPNPFATLDSGQSAALWSLSGNGKLIELGLSRGFAPCGSFSVDPAVAARLCFPKGLCAPTTSPFATGGVAIEGFKAPRRGRPSAWEASYPVMRLSTIALITGHELLAKALCSAGAELPQIEGPLAKARDVARGQPEKQRFALEERAALWEAIVLGLEVDALARKKAKRFKIPPLPPSPRKPSRL